VEEHVASVITCKVIGLGLNGHKDTTIVMTRLYDVKKRRSGIFVKDANVAVR
jgi:hypothetical protein